MSNNNNSSTGCLGGVVVLLPIAFAVVAVVAAIGMFLVGALLTAAVVGALVMTVWLPVRVMRGNGITERLIISPDLVHETGVLGKRPAGSTEMLPWDRAWPNYFPYQFNQDIKAIRVEAQHVTDAFKSRLVGDGEGAVRSTAAGIGGAVFSVIIRTTTWLGVTIMQLIAKIYGSFQKGYGRRLHKKEVENRAAMSADIQCTECFRLVDMPAFRCPSCSNLHYDISPGALGLRERICQCGTTLPVGVLEASKYMQAVCPHDGCHADLAPGSGTRRLASVPVFGTVSSGKSTFIHSAAARMETDLPHLQVQPLNENSADFLTLAADNHARGLAPAKTALDQKQYGYSMVVSSPNEAIELHFIDAAGERFRAVEDSQDLIYLDYSKAFVLVVDPLSLDYVRDRMTRSDAAHYMASDESPSNAYGAVVDRLLEASVDFTDRALAIVVSKADAVNTLFPESPIGYTSPEVRQWLWDNGADDLVRRAEIDFGENSVTYFAVDSLTPTASGIEGFSPLNVMEWSVQMAGGSLGVPAWTKPLTPAQPDAVDQGSAYQPTSGDEPGPATQTDREGV